MVRVISEPQMGSDLESSLNYWEEAQIPESQGSLAPGGILAPSATPPLTLLDLGHSHSLSRPALVPRPHLPTKPRTEYLGLAGHCGDHQVN